MRAMGATLVKRHSSSWVVGKPSSEWKALAQLHRGCGLAASAGLFRNGRHSLPTASSSSSMPRPA